MFFCFFAIASSLKDLSIAKALIRLALAFSWVLCLGLGRACHWLICLLMHTHARTHHTHNPYCAQSNKTELQAALLLSTQALLIPSFKMNFSSSLTSALSLFMTIGASGCYYVAFWSLEGENCPNYFSSKGIIYLKKRTVKKVLRPFF